MLPVLAADVSPCAVVRTPAWGAESVVKVELLLVHDERRDAGQPGQGHGQGRGDVGDGGRDGGVARRVGRVEGLLGLEVLVARVVEHDERRAEPEAVRGRGGRGGRRQKARAVWAWLWRCHGGG